MDAGSSSKRGLKCKVNLQKTIQKVSWVEALKYKTKKNPHVQTNNNEMFYVNILYAQWHVE